MNMTIIVGDKTFTATNLIHLQCHPRWDNRPAVEFIIVSTYAEVVETFVDDITWIVRNESDIDMSEYSVPGPITDNRDGTITVSMGKPTELEKMIETIYGGVNNAD